MRFFFYSSTGGSGVGVGVGGGVGVGVGAGGGVGVGVRSVGASLARKHLDVLNGGHYTPSALQFPPRTWVVVTQ